MVYLSVNRQPTNFSDNTSGENYKFTVDKVLPCGLTFNKDLTKGNIERLTNSILRSCGVPIRALFYSATPMIPVLSLIRNRLRGFLVVETTIPTFLHRRLPMFIGFIERNVLEITLVRFVSLRPNGLRGLQDGLSQRLSRASRGRVPYILICHEPSQLPLRRDRRVRRYNVLSVLTREDRGQQVTGAEPRVFRLLGRRGRRLIGERFHLTLETRKNICNSIGANGIDRRQTRRATKRATTGRR